jgi:uncharacterized protein
MQPESSICLLAPWWGRSDRQPHPVPNQPRQFVDPILRTGAGVTVSDEELVERYREVTVDRGFELDHDNRDHYRGRLEHQLLMNRCAACGFWQFPPRPICPACWSWDIAARPVTGRGTIFMTMFLHQGPSAEGVDYSNPYPVVTVELDEQEGLRFTATVLGARKDQIHIGDRVELDWIVREGVPVPAFRLTGEA